MKGTMSEGAYVVGAFDLYPKNTPISRVARYLLATNKTSEFSVLKKCFSSLKKLQTPCLYKSLQSCSCKIFNTNPELKQKSSNYLSNLLAPLAQAIWTQFLQFTELKLLADTLNVIKDGQPIFSSRQSEGNKKYLVKNCEKTQFSIEIVSKNYEILAIFIQTSKVLDPGFLIFPDWQKISIKCCSS